MVNTILIVGLALYWLLIETDYLRVNLMGIMASVGDCCEWRLQDSQVTDGMKIDLRKQWFNGRGCDKLIRCHFEQDGAQPLFGWGYAYQYRNLQPEYKIELIDEHSHYTMRTDNMKVLKDVFRVYRNPYLKVKL